MTINIRLTMANFIMDFKFNANHIQFISNVKKSNYEINLEHEIVSLIQ